jgi:Zn-dependent peptidase ImmA (M78 family)/DNA-binding XRE family transcriptional regulator
MNYQLLGKNIKRLRNGAGLSQNALATAAGISLPSIKLIESGKGSPRMRTLQQIAGGLQVKLQDLFMPMRELSSVRFRSNHTMANREKILNDVAKWLDNFNYLEEVTRERVPYKFRNRAGEFNADAIIEAAAKCRKILGLRDDEPVRDICGLLENAGIKVFPMPMASDGFFGLSVDENDNGPAIVVNSWERIPTERKIFSAAHELGHLVLHKDAFNVAESGENLEEERQADLFAGYFLMPDKGFNKEWNEAYGLHKVDRVFKVKRIFHISYKTILFRLTEHGATKSIWGQFAFAYQQRYHRKLAFKEEPYGISAEPAGLQKWDFYEDRFSRLVRKALEKDKISLSHGAEILSISIEEMQELLRNWEDIL